MNKLLITGFQFRDIIENSREVQMNQISAEDLSLLSIDYDEGLYMLSLASTRLNNQVDANEFVDVTAYFPSGMVFCGIIQSDFESIKEENRVRFNLTENTAVDQIVREEISAAKIEDLEEKMLSPSETCRLFNPKISLVTLNSWAGKGLLVKHYIGGRTYYKYSQVINSFKTLKRYHVK